MSKQHNLQIFTLAGFAKAKNRSYESIRRAVIAATQNKAYFGYNPESFANQFAGYSIYKGNANTDAETYFIVAFELFQT